MVTGLEMEGASSSSRARAADSAAAEAMMASAVAASEGVVLEMGSLVRVRQLFDLDLRKEALFVVTMGLLVDWIYILRRENMYLSMVHHLLL